MNIGIIFLGVGALFLVNAILILKRKRYGPEEGMRGNLFIGKTAIFAGVIMSILGIALLSCGLMLLLSSR